MSKAIILLALVVIASLAFALPAFAEDIHATFVVGQKSYAVNGKTFEMDAAPFIENGRTFVPLRYIGYALGVKPEDITWDGQTATLTRGKIKQMFTVGSNEARAMGTDWEYRGRNRDDTLDVYGVKIVNDTVQRAFRVMDVAPVLRNGRVYLPARCVAEGFAADVGWDPGTQTVYIDRTYKFPPSKPKPVGHLIEFTYGSKTVYVDGKPVEISAAPVRDDYSYVPLADFLRLAGITDGVVYDEKRIIVPVDEDWRSVSDSEHPVIDPGTNRPTLGTLNGYVFERDNCNYYREGFNWYLGGGTRPPKMIDGVIMVRAFDMLTIIGSVMCNADGKQHIVEGGNIYRDPKVRQTNTITGGYIRIDLPWNELPQRLKDQRSEPIY